MHKKLEYRRRTAFVICHLSFIIISGCDLFSTRAPEPPSTSSTFIWTPATTVQTLIADFTGSLAALDPSNYIRCFISNTDSTGTGSKPFVFKPRTGLDPASQSVFNNWSVDGPSESERAWVGKLAILVTSGSKLGISFGSATPVQNSSTTASLTTTYAIAVPVAASSGIPDTVRGSVEMQFEFVSTEQGTKEWRIVSWTDFLPPNGGLTWTDLKLKLSP